MSEELSSRRHEWVDPAHLTEQFRRMSVMEFFSAWKDGHVVPPIAATLGFRLTAFDEGKCRDHV